MFENNVLLFLNNVLKYDGWLYADYKKKFTVQLKVYYYSNHFFSQVNNPRTIEIFNQIRIENRLKYFLTIRKKNLLWLTNNLINIVKVFVKLFFNIFTF